MGVSNQYKIDHSNTLHQAFEQKVLYDKNEELLLKFINFLKNKTEISSQLYQDMFAEFIVNENHKKTFLEFGATDGLKLSNTYSLENHFSWKGVLAEPDPQWHNKLISNRPNTKIIFDCVWKKSNEKLKFLSSEIGEYSTIEKFKYSDKEVMPFNTEDRIKNSKIIDINTISLNELIDIEFKDQAPSYMSVDTEGSEFEILSNFNFKKYRPHVFTVEHNYTNYQKKIDQLMSLNGYLRVFNKLTAFDAWYVSKETIEKFDC